MSEDGVTPPSDAILRERMREAHEHLKQTLDTAKALPPIVQASGNGGPCASCGQPTRVAKWVEGREVLICGACAVKEMDDWEQQARKGPSANA